MRKTKFSHKAIAIFLVFTFLPSTIPVNYVFASNNGPNAPEAASFEPVDATDMVNLSSGDVSYVLPLLEMDGFPVTLGYHAGIPLDMESSWTGLGWNINTGAINRSVSGTPDDWKNGNSLDFIYFQDSEKFYNINVGVGLSQTAEVGVGISWGSNKSLSGSVYGTFMMVNGSIDTDGNYSAGIGLSAGGNNFGGGLGVSISGNVNGGASRVGANIGVGGSTKSGAQGSLGYSLTDGSVSLSGGYGNRSSYDKGQAGGGSVSLGNYSSGDYDISSKGFFIPVQVWIFNLSFGYRKVTYQLDKAYPKLGYGSLYAKDATLNDNPFTDALTDKQHRYKYTDLYEQTVPSEIEEFITDYETEREKTNFSFASYDSYSVNAPGLSGLMQPKIFENATFFGQGYAGPDSDDPNRKMRMYYHNSKPSTRSFGTSTANGSDNIEFYFNGQFTENISIPNNMLTGNSATTLNNYLPGGTANNNKQRSANFVEVYTNQQLADPNIKVMRPESGVGGTLPNDGIGAYKITAPDGKTYHYSLPVYHYEQVERNLIKDNSQQNVNEKRQYSPYATHWLLTAITGPDFIDTDNDNVPDEGDYGYWVRMDYGNWSDGFVWRSPYKGKKYNTNLAGEIEKEDFGNYQYGRKQLYYLDKVVTREHTAYFVKDLRYDSTGAHGTNDYNDGNQTTYNYVFDGQDTVEDAVNGGSTQVGENISYQREYQLMLDKIVVVENDGSFHNKNANPSLALDNGSCFPGYAKDATHNPGFDIGGGGFKAEYGSNYTYPIHQESSVYDVTDFQNFDYSQAFKVIDLTYSYELAKNTPSSLYCNGYGDGRLTLKSIFFNGKGNASYMPPYRFDYKNEMDYPEGLAFNKYYASDFLTGQGKDGWGFIDEKQIAGVYESTDYEKYGPDNWSLSEITTPTGGKIKLEYEEDDYEQEAFSRKLWQDNIQFAIWEDSNSLDYILKIKNQEGLNPNLIVNFEDYFEVNDSVFLDLWLVRTYDLGLFTEDRLGGINIDQDFINEITVEAISNDNTLFLRVNRSSVNDGFIVCPNSSSSTLCDPNAVTFLGNSVFGDFGERYFAKKDGLGSNIFVPLPRGQYENSLNDNADHHTMTYRLLASRVPKDIKGGGVRAKSIIVSDENGREYKTNYYYNQPGTPRDKNHPDYKSSGITSFAPENSIKFIPYQSELPSPGVMYEYVTMVPVSTNGNELGSTRYRFHTMDPIFNLFDPNLEMTYTSETINPVTGQPQEKDITIFKSTVDDHGNGDYYDAGKKTYAKTIDLKINTALVGQFRSIETFNKEGHLMSKTHKYYDDTYVNPGQNAKVIPGRGTVRESFQSMKSVFSTDANDANPILKSRHLSISSKEDFSTVLTEVRTTTGGFTETETYKDADFQTGAFRTTEMQKADGTLVRTRQLPAYTQYSNMGSKVDDQTNKHMLTQRAMTFSDVEVNGAWKTTGAAVTTWRPENVYDNGDATNATDDGIWRKHQGFIWKDDVDANGTFGTELTNTDFTWGENVSQTNAQWQKISETTRYNHWSMPLEVMDINENYVSTKMGDDHKKVFATGNAGYNELYYSGAEDLNGTAFGGHVGLGTAEEELAPDHIHTGVRSLKIAANETGFEVDVLKGKKSDYKVSLWAKFGTHDDVKIKLGTSTNYTAFDPDETVRAGDWIQLNYYFSILGASQTVSVINTAGTAYVDDFRLHPVASAMTAYVYNEFDELTHILGSNNMATHYEYDEAGRLIKTYTEVEDFNGAGSGGIKPISEHQYTYKY